MSYRNVWWVKNKDEQTIGREEMPGCFLPPTKFCEAIADRKLIDWAGAVRMPMRREQCNPFYIWYQTEQYD